MDQFEEDFGPKKREAYERIAAAWNDAVSAGIESEIVAQAALFAALSDLVEIYGEDAVAGYASGLAERISHGAFSIPERLN